MPVVPEEISVTGMIARYWACCQTFHTFLSWDGTPSEHLDVIKVELAPLRHLYSDVNAADLGPRHYACCRTTGRART
jgi:hypothetical protein